MIRSTNDSVVIFGKHGLTGSSFLPSSGGWPCTRVEIGARNRGSDPSVRMLGEGGVV